MPNPVGFVYDVYESVVGDFNGDGRSDILYRVPAMNLDGTCQKVTESTASFVLPTPSTCFGVWNLRLGTDTGLGPRMSVPGIPASPGGDWIYTPRVLDIDGDGKDEILLFTDPGVQVYGLSDCSTSHCDFAPVATVSTYANFGRLDAYKGLLSQSSPVQIADLNGDGLVDVIGEEPVASQSQATNLYFSAGDRPPEGPFYPYGSFGSTRTLLVPTTSPNALSPIHTMIGDERFVVDIDGNGQYEFLTPVYNSNQSPVTLSAVHISSDPSASSQLTATTLAVAQTDACHHTSRFFFDFNGDGLVDSLTLTSPNDLVGCAGELTTASVAVNSGSAFRAATALPLSSDAQPPPAVALNNFTTDYGDTVDIQRFPRLYDQGIRIADLDGDGRTDVVLMATNSGTGAVRWLRSTDSGLQVIPLGIPAAPARYMSGGVNNSDNGSFGPRLAQIGDFNGDGLLDIVMPSVSNLFVFLQTPYLPDLVTSISGGPLTPARTIAYAHTTPSSGNYTRGQCQWPQACLKSVGWVVTSSTVEASNFDAPKRIVTEYQYEDARADRLGRGIVGVRKWTTTVRDASPAASIYSTSTTEFDLSTTVCHDQSHNECAYANAGTPSRQTTTIPISGTTRRIRDTQSQRTLVPMPGPFGYRLTQQVQIADQREQWFLNVPIGISPNTPLILQDAVLSATRSTSTYDEFGNPLSIRSEVSPDTLPIDGSVAAGQRVYMTQQQASQPQ